MELPEAKDGLLFLHYIALSLLAYPICHRGIIVRLLNLCICGSVTLSWRKNVRWFEGL